MPARASRHRGLKHSILSTTGVGSNNTCCEALEWVGAASLRATGLRLDSAAARPTRWHENPFAPRGNAGTTAT